MRTQLLTKVKLLRGRPLGAYAELFGPIISRIGSKVPGLGWDKALVIAYVRRHQRELCDALAGIVDRQIIVSFMQCGLLEKLCDSLYML